MKSAEQLIADYLQQSLRPDIDAGSLATYLVRHLRDYGWRLARYTEAQHVETKDEPGHTLVQPRHLSPDMLRVYCAALTGLYNRERSPLRHDLIAEAAMMAVDACAKVTK